MSTIVITGATGNIGHALVQHLLQEGHRVVAVSRASARLDALAAAGAETRVIDITQEAATLTDVLRGADAAFLMVPPNVTHPDLLAYGNQVAAVFEQAVRDSGIRRVVQLSSLGGDLPTGTGPIIYLHHLENRLRNIPGLNLLILRPTYFLENLFNSIGMIKAMGINGGAQRPEVAIPMIATRDIAAYAAKRLTALDFTNEEVQPLLGARNYSMQEATAALGRAIGRPELPYVQFPYDQAEQGMIGAGLSPSMARLYTEMVRGVNEVGLFGDAPRTAESTTATTLQDWATHAFAPAFGS